MNKVIRDIIDKKCSDVEKNKELNSLSNDIAIAKGILSGKFQYCEDCDDYYLTGSYLEEVKREEARICVWQDPINSGGNEYEKRVLDITYRICPKGHRKVIDA